MSRFIAIALLALSACIATPQPQDCTAPTSTPGPLTAAPTLDGGVVLWVGAHPDDETTAALLLTDWCGRARCVFLVLTKGEGGNCGLAGGCQPDLATVRTLEMQASARLFDAGLVQETLPNAAFDAEEAKTKWVAAAGSEEALIERVAKVLRDEHVDTLITFDPRHGVTCHGEHRLAGALAITAGDRVGLPRDRMLLLASRLDARESAPGVLCLLGYRAAVAEDPALRWLSPDAGGWGRSLEVFRAHPSQFSASMLTAAEHAPETVRSSWYLWADAFAIDDPRYADVCR